MKPYYEHAGITIYHGDCREVLPLVAADVFVTDPPYGVEGGLGGDARIRGKSAYGSSAWADTPQYVCEVACEVVRGLSVSCRAGAVTPGVRMMFAYPQPVDVGCLWTPSNPCHGPWGFTTFHPILYYGSDWRAGIGALPSGLLVTESAPKNGHPCPKPLKAWSWLVGKVSRDGDVILDPFAGSGTTLRAAKNLGRRAIGIEIEEKYCEIAARYLAQEVMQFGETP